MLKNKALLKSLSLKAYFPLLTFFVLLFCSFIYGSKISLDLDFEKKGNSLQAVLDRQLENGSLFLEFGEALSGSTSVSVYLVSENPNRKIYEGEVDASENFRNIPIFRKFPNLPAGKIRIEFSTFQDVKAVRLEYRHSALKMYLERLGKDGYFSLLCLLSIIFTTAIALSFWVYGSNVFSTLGLLAVCIFNIWLTFAPMSGNDDTYYIPGMAILSGWPLDDARGETVQYIKDTHYLERKRVNREVRAKIYSKDDFCPHMLAFPNSTDIENCPHSSALLQKIYAAIFHVFPNSTIAEIESRIWMLNQLTLIIILTAFAYAMTMNGRFGESWFTVMIASVIFFPLWSQTATTSTEMTVFGMGALHLFLLYKSLELRHEYKKVWLFCMSLIVALILIKYDEPSSNKNMTLLLYPFLILFNLVLEARKSVQRKNLYISLFTVSVAILVLSFDTIRQIWISEVIPFLHGAEVNRVDQISFSKILNLTAGSLAGSLKGGIDLPPTIVQAVFLAIVFFYTAKGFTLFHPKGLRSKISIATPILIVPLGLILLGLVTRDHRWISLRFFYGFLPAWIYLISLTVKEYKYASGVIAALVVCIALHTYYLSSFIFSFH